MIIESEKCVKLKEVVINIYNNQITIIDENGLHDPEPGGTNKSNW